MPERRGGAYLAEAMTEGETFQHYQVLRRADGSAWELGRGAMGVTYKAHDTSLHCPVALKVIRAESLDNDLARQRFVREARAAAQLNHPNVARVFHLGESIQSYFYAMEFIDGETLEATVRQRGPLRADFALRIALQVANALRAAAREGLVHRDLKPSNLMLVHDADGNDDLHVKVIDFGLAKVQRETGDHGAAHDTITVAGFVGTPNYASPEQLEEKELDARSDFYSLGVTLWYLLTGKPPFAGSVVQIMSQHLSRTPPFEALRSQPPAVVALLRHLLEKEPDQRPQTAQDLRREIENALALVGGPAARIQADAPSPPVRPHKTSAGRHLLTWILLLIGFVLIAGSVALAAWYLFGPVDAPVKSSPPEKRQHATLHPVDSRQLAGVEVEVVVESNRAVRLVLRENFFQPRKHRRVVGMSFVRRV